VSDLACDRCGLSLLANEDVRYKLEIRIYAAYDPLELSSRELRETDFDAEFRRLVAACEARSPEELEAEVWKEFRFDLCGRCQREVVKDPLPRRAPDPN
jgi:hypothetical protein